MDESSETYDPILPGEPDESEGLDELDLPKKKSSAPPPLPRMWKTPVDPAEVEAEQALKAQKAKELEQAAPKKPKVKKPLFIEKKKKPAETVDDGTGASKLEETPVLDTYEARQRARLLIGGLGVAICVIFGFILLSAFKGNSSEEITEGELPAASTVSNVKPDLELEARSLLETAKKSDKLGKTDAAVKLLAKLISTYPKTAAAREGQGAVDRHKQNKPLFGDELTGQASAPTKGPETGPSSTATGPTPPSSTSPTSTAPPTNVTKTGPEPPRSATPPVGPTVVANPVPPTPPPMQAIQPLPSGYRPNFNFPIHPSGWPTRIHSDRDDAEMVLVPAGAFDMGRGDGEPQEGPIHPVSLTSYYIDQHEVTVRQFTKFLKSSGRPMDAVNKGIPKGVDHAAYEDYPIVNVSSVEAAEFCKWAKRSLPTEAQWEYAARSSDGRISFWNGELPRKDPEKGPRAMQAVMSLPSDLSAFGVYDLGANAWEWTADIYDSRYYNQAKDLVFDPAGPAKKNRTGLISMSVRGGSKNGFLTWREGLKIETRASYLGFRGALSVEATPAQAPAAGPNPAQPPAGPNRPGGASQPF